MSVVSLISFVGVLGAVLLLIAWIPQTLRTIKTRKVGMERKFLYIYLLGSLFLTIYAYSLEDWVFLILNAVATLMAAINIYYYEKYERPKSKKIKRR